MRIRSPNNGVEYPLIKTQQILVHMVCPLISGGTLVFGIIGGSLFEEVVEWLHVVSREVAQLLFMFVSMARHNILHTTHHM